MPNKEAQQPKLSTLPADYLAAALKAAHTPPWSTAEADCGRDQFPSTYFDTFPSRSRGEACSTTRGSHPKPRRRSKDRVTLCLTTELCDRLRSTARSLHRTMSSIGEKALTVELDRLENDGETGGRTSV